MYLPPPNLKEGFVAFAWMNTAMPVPLVFDLSGVEALPAPGTAIEARLTPAEEAMAGRALP